jgi:hypothetical protein
MPKHHFLPGCAPTVQLSVADAETTAIAANACVHIYILVSV